MAQLYGNPNLHTQLLVALYAPQSFSVDGLAARALEYGLKKDYCGGIDGKYLFSISNFMRLSDKNTI